MRRLREQTEFNAVAEELLADLVRSAEAFQSNPFSKRRVLLRMQRVEEPRTRRWFRSAVMVGVLSFAATAAAAAGYTWFAESRPEPAPQLQESSTPPRPLAAAQKSNRSLGMAASAPEPLAEPQKAPPPALLRRTPARVAPSADARVKALSAPPADGEDPSEVIDALRALRKDGDPKRAQTLLDGYLKSNPAGALAEDALALSIEAAAARRDPRAADYARRYLQRFPNGRYRSLALKASQAR